MLNTKVLKLEEDIVNLINESGIAPAIVSLILERIQHEASFAVKQAVQQERQQQPVEQPITPASEDIQEPEIVHVNDGIDIK